MRTQDRCIYLLKSERPTGCHLLFYFASYVLNMFRTLIYPSSGACDCVDELPHRSSCPQFVVCLIFGAAGFRWCSFCRLKHNCLSLFNYYNDARSNKHKYLFVFSYLFTNLFIYSSIHSFIHGTFNPVFNFQYYLLLKDRMIVLRSYKPLPQMVRTTAFAINEGYHIVISTRYGWRGI